MLNWEDSPFGEATYVSYGSVDLWYYVAKDAFIATITNKFEEISKYKNLNKIYSETKKHRITF